MNPAVEYLVRSGCIRNVFRMPISLFLFNPDTEVKMVITVKEELPASNYCTVNHWNVTDCQFYQVLPSLCEFRIPKNKLFSHHATVLPGWQLLEYRCEPTPAETNEVGCPIMGEIYDYYFDNFCDSFLHREAKVNWLWAEFIDTYFPEICQFVPYIEQKDSPDEFAEKQRTFIMKEHPKVWSFWKKWNKYLLFPEHVPGELVFASEYD